MDQSVIVTVDALVELNDAKCLKTLALKMGKTWQLQSFMEVWN